MNPKQKWYFKYGADEFYIFAAISKDWSEISGCAWRSFFFFFHLPVNTQNPSFASFAGPYFPPQSWRWRHALLVMWVMQLPGRRRQSISFVEFSCPSQECHCAFWTRDVWLNVHSCKDGSGMWSGGQRSAVTPSNSAVISERRVKQKPAENNCTCFYLRVQIQSRWRVNKWI